MDFDEKKEDCSWGAGGVTGKEAFFLSLCFGGLSLTPGVPHKGLGLQPLYPDGSDGQRGRLRWTEGPAQMDRGTG